MDHALNSNDNSESGRGAGGRNGRSRKRVAYDHAMAKGGWGTDGGRSLKAAIEAREREGRIVRRRVASPQWAGVLTILLSLGSVTVASGAYAVGNFATAFFSTCVLLIAVIFWWRLRHALGSGVWASGAISIAVLASFGVIGAQSQLVTTSGVAMHGSVADKMLREADVLTSDLKRLEYWDGLAGLDASSANTKLDELSAAKAAADALAADTNKAWASPGLISAAENIRQAGAYAAVALEARYNLALQYDERIAGNLNAARSALSIQALAAKQLIAIAHQAALAL